MRLEIDPAAERRDVSRPAVLHIENNGEIPLRINAVTHLLPAGLTLIAVAGNSYLQKEQTHRDLCKELRLLIQDEFFFSNPALISARRQQIIQLINEAIVAAPGPGMAGRIMRVWRVFLSPALAAAAFSRWHERFNANQLVIEDYRDAESAWELVSGLPVPEQEKNAHNRELIAIKLRQLKAIEEERNSRVFGGGGWIVGAHTSHSEALILNCKKSAFSSRHYPVVIEVSAVPLEGASQLTIRESASLDVPPKDLTLATLAMLCAPIGRITRLVVENPRSGIGTLIGQAEVAHLLVASVLAFILSIAYERIKWGHTAMLSLTWRTAILLGFAAGVGTENLLRAIQAFFGIT